MGGAVRVGVLGRGRGRVRVGIRVRVRVRVIAINYTCTIAPQKVSSSLTDIVSPTMTVIPRASPRVWVSATVWG